MLLATSSQTAAKSRSSCLIKASSVFPASFRYMAACCRKYSSQSMFHPASRGHEHITSERSMARALQAVCVLSDDGSGAGRNGDATCGSPMGWGLLIGSQKRVWRPRLSGALLKRFRDLLEWLSRIGRRFLGKCRETLRLFGERFELLARVRGRQFEKLRWRFDARELTSKVEGCIHIRLSHLKEMEIEIHGTLRGAGVGALHGLRGFLGGGLYFAVRLLDALTALLDKVTCYVFCHGT